MHPPRRAIAPTALRPRGEMMSDYGGRGLFPVPTEMTLGDLVAVRKGFVDAANRVSNAGFDGVEIHAANGYLLDQFNTEYTNLREDEYGGPPDARIRYAAEIVSAVRAAQNIDRGHRAHQIRPAVPDLTTGSRRRTGPGSSQHGLLQRRPRHSIPSVRR